MYNSFTVGYTLHLLCILHLNVLGEAALKGFVEFLDMATVTYAIIK